MDLTTMSVGKANISNAIWPVLLSNPELEGLKKINGLAAANVKPSFTPTVVFKGPK